MNVALVAVRVPPGSTSVAVSVYVLPIVLTEQPANEATPAVALSGLVVQESVPGPLPVVTARLTLDVSVVTMFPPASSTVTWGWVVKAAPPVELLGCWVNRI